MTTWNPDKYIDAWNFASVVHNGQLVPGTKNPYINHIGLVAMEAMAAVANSDNINNPDLLIQCALLHDTIEDTKCTSETIKQEFGTGVADGVIALTKDGNLSTKVERMKDSIARIQKQPKEVWMVKLCDRITNLQPPPKHWDKDKIKAYFNEAKLILESLGESNDYLSIRLQTKIDNYEYFLGTFTVYIDDNFHYMDESERYTHGEYETYEEAVKVCQVIVDKCLGGLKDKKNNKDIYSKYCLFGDDPWIMPVPEGKKRFSARDYAFTRCKESS